MEDKPQKQKWITSALLTAIIIVSCVVVYLLTEGGYGMETRSAARADYTPAPVLLPSQSQFLEEGLYGMNYRQTGEHAFALARTDDELAEAALLLSLQGRAVCAFTLVAQLPPFPEEPGAKATALEEELYIQRQSQYAAQTAWVQTLFTSMANALDTGDRLTAADVDSLWTYASEAALTRKRKEETIDAHSLRAYMDASGPLPVLHISLQDESAKAETEAGE